MNERIWEGYGGQRKGRGENRRTSQNMKYTADLWQSRVIELLSQGTGVASTLQHLQILLQSFLKNTNAWALPVEWSLINTALKQYFLKAPPLLRYL